MSGKFLARASAILLALLLGACGGGDGSTSLSGANDSDGGSGSDDSGDTPTTVDVGSIRVLANPTQITTSSTATSSISVLVKNESGILMEGVDVSFTASDNGSLQITQGTTDESGLATATLSTVGDSRNRTVTVTAAAGGVSDTVDVAASGTTISINGPSSIAIGNSATYRVSLLNADGLAISGEQVSVSSKNNTLSAAVLTTDTSGTVSFDLTAQTGGVDTITVSAFEGESRVSASQPVAVSPDSFAFTAPAENQEINLNSTRTMTIEWLTNDNPVASGKNVQFSTTRGTLNPVNGLTTTDANGIASVDITSTNSGPAIVTATDPDSGLTAQRSIEFVATTPDSLSIQVTKSQLGYGDQTDITAVVRDANNNLVKNQTVYFTILADGSSGSLVSSSNVTDTLGRAMTTYIGGEADSGKNGVEIEARVGGSISDSVFLTVTRRSLRLSLGTGNEIFEPDTVSYRKPWVAIVTDANGAPVEGAEVELSILPIAYAKGFWEINANGDAWQKNVTTNPICSAEDVNQNGIVDPGEDVNNNGSLEPTNSAATSTGTLISSSDGSANFEILYPQNHCGWVKTRLTATVRVSGTENTETAEFFLSCSAEDLSDIEVEPPGGIEGLYGLASSCANPD